MLPVKEIGTRGTADGVAAIPQGEVFAIDIPVEVEIRRVVQFDGSQYDRLGLFGGQVEYFPTQAKRKAVPAEGIELTDDGVVARDDGELVSRLWGKNAITKIVHPNVEQAIECELIGNEQVIVLAARREATDFDFQDRVGIEAGTAVDIHHAWRVTGRDGHVAEVDVADHLVDIDLTAREVGGADGGIQDFQREQPPSMLSVLFVPI